MLVNGELLKKPCEEGISIDAHADSPLGANTSHYRLVTPGIIHGAHRQATAFP